jgi:type IV pilus assembly protein PilF
MNALKTADRHFPLTTRVLLGITLALVLGACVSTTSTPGGTITTETSKDKEKKRQSAAAINVQLGMAYLHQDNIAAAKEKLDRAMQEEPRDPSVHSAMALLYDRTGKSAQADEEFREALRLAPHDPDTLNNYAVYLCRVGRTDEGVKYFLDAANNALYSTPAAAFTNAGVCLRAAKRYEQATAQFQKALSVRPNFAEAAYQLVDTNFTLGALKDARTQLDSYLGAFDATPDLLLIGVRIARAQGDRLSAERFSRRLRVDFPGSEQVRLLSELDRNPG